jgi:hypothetical protein
LIALETDQGTTFVRKTEAAKQHGWIPSEEQVLMKSLFGSENRESLSVDDATTANAIWQVAQQLRNTVQGMWFSDNKNSIIAGTVMSLMAVCVTANPHSSDHWGALLLGLAVMAPGGYYLLFVLLRFHDLIRASREHFDVSVLPQVGLLLFLSICCVASFMIGCVVLVVNFGLMVVVVTGLLVAVNVASLLWLKMPTQAGQELLDAIDGFREYLNSVERLPMDKQDAPGARAGLYEKYLPYAVALEVEQSWSDSFIAANSSYHESEVAGLHPFYLGMWDGKPVEVAFSAQAPRRY